MLPGELQSHCDSLASLASHLEQTQGHQSPASCASRHRYPLLTTSFPHGSWLTSPPTPFLPEASASSGLRYPNLLTNAAPATTALPVAEASSFSRNYGQPGPRACWEANCSANPQPAPARKRLSDPRVPPLPSGLHLLGLHPRTYADLFVCARWRSKWLLSAPGPNNTAGLSTENHDLWARLSAARHLVNQYNLAALIELCSAILSVEFTPARFPHSGVINLTEMSSAAILLSGA